MSSFVGMAEMAVAFEELQKSGIEFIIIEKEPSMQQVIPEPMKWFIGDATQDDNLKEVGIDKASSIIITTP